MNNSLLIKETKQHWLDVASHWPCLLRSRWPRTFPLTGLDYGSRVVGVNPGFVTRNDIPKKDGVVSGIFFEFQANVKSLLFLVDTKESDATGCFFKSSVTILWQVSWLFFHSNPRFGTCLNVTLVRTFPVLYLVFVFDRVWFLQCAVLFLKSSCENSVLGSIYLYSSLVSRHIN